MQPEPRPALTALLIRFVANRLHSSGQTLGYLIAGLGIGYLCGSAVSKVLISRYATRTIRVAAYASVGLCFLVIFTATTLPIALVAVTACGVPRSGSTGRHRAPPADTDPGWRPRPGLGRFLHQ